MFKRKMSQAADSAAAAVARTGQKVAGDKGVRAANKITGPLFGQTFERCGDACTNGTCNH